MRSKRGVNSGSDDRTMRSAYPASVVFGADAVVGDTGGDVVVVQSGTRSTRKVLVGENEFRLRQALEPEGVKQDRLKLTNTSRGLVHRRVGTVSSREVVRVREGDSRVGLAISERILKR